MLAILLDAPLKWAVLRPDWLIRVEPEHPLAGHAGHCDKVTVATITGETDRPCTCAPQK